MTTRQLQRRCQSLVNSLRLPRPFSVEAFVRELAAQRDRPIYLKTLPAGTGTTACGIWLRTDTHDEIFFEEQTTPFHREHIILHEVGHMLCGHEADGAELATELGRYLPNVSPELIKRMLGRTNYTSDQEQEAELVASLIRTAADTIGRQASGGVRGELEIALGIRE